MKASELRIGNWVEEGVLGEVPIISIEPNMVWVNTKHMGSGMVIQDVTYHLDVESIIGIPLTEEWLLKFGFIEDSYSYVMGVHQQIFSGLMKFNFNERLNCWEFSIGSYNDLTRIQYVHQLQNLYFALTGEELKIEEL